MKQVSLLVVFIAAIAFLGSCDKKKACSPEKETYMETYIYKTPHLPEGSVITKKFGNGWYYFTLDGKKYLYRSRFTDTSIETSVMSRAD